jgi:PAS domain S-box-containing protein
MWSCSPPSGHQASVALRRAQLYEEVAWMQEYTASILRHMDSGVLAVSHAGLITVLNDAAAHLLGLAAHEVLGHDVTAVLPDELACPIRHTLDGKATYTNHEAALQRGAERPLPIALSTSIWHGQDGAPAGTILVFTDISRLKELEEDKRRSERLASIGAFVSGVVHEIRNPLVAIKTLAELLPRQYEDAEFRYTFTMVALQEVERLEALVRRLRSLTAATQKLCPLFLTAPLEETLALLTGECTRRRIKVTCTCAQPLLPVLGDHDQLKQVFLNLCLNGLEAMGEEGTLQISVSLHAPHGTRPELMVRISDTGPGIPTEYLPHLFEPFVTSKDTGTGLGLAICRGIIDYHRGSICAANNRTGPGATFTLSIPALQGEEAHAIPPPRR